MKIGIHRKKKNFDKAKNVIDDNSRFEVIEGYKTARTNLIFSLAAYDRKCVAFTSWSQGEGKSTATANMAISLSKMEKKVVLIDADLRKPNIHNLMKLKNDSGFSEVAGKFKQLDKVINSEVLPCLDIITSGPIPPNPSELLGSVQMKGIFEKLEERYDYILFDTPPMGLVTDALMLKNFIAGYVVVVRERSTTHGDIENLIQNIRLVDSQILGFLKVGCKLSDGKHRRKAGYNSYDQS